MEGSTVETSGAMSGGGRPSRGRIRTGNTANMSDPESILTPKAQRDIEENANTVRVGLMFD